jgi:Galactose oxidase, central domain
MRRWGAVATILADQRVLITGGDGQNPGPMTEVYDPREGRPFASNDPIWFRTRQTATRLLSGKVLLAGGDVNCSGVSDIAAELWDPATGEFTSNSSLHMISARCDHTATLLHDGRVLLAGGESHGYFTSPPGQPNTLIGHSIVNRSAEFYDPKAGRFVATGSMKEARENHSATLLSDGRVLIAGGDIAEFRTDALASAELFDPKTGRFTPTGAMSSTHTAQTATLLANGKVLIAGGKIWVRSKLDGVPTDDAELYDPRTGKFSVAGKMTSAREGHTATLLGNGQVLIAGGAGTRRDQIGDAAVRTAELYDPATGKSTSIGNMPTTHYKAIAVRLPDGRVLIAGS